MKIEINDHHLFMEDFGENDYIFRSRDISKNG